MSFGEVTSDTVGYQYFNANQGFTMLAPSFAGIDSDYPIQSIKISGDNVYGEGGESLQIVNSYGNVEESYTWYAAGIFGANEGWYSDEDSSFADRTFDPAESILLNNDEGEYTICFAGKVNYEKIDAFPCDQGFTSVGNMTPIAKNIQKFVIAGDNVYGEGGESLQVLNAYGNVEESYTWYAAGIFGVNEGWYSDEDSSFASNDIPAGQGFLLNNDEGEYTVSIPATND